MSVKKGVHSLIAIIIMFGFGYLPVLEPITPMGMKVVGAFLGCIYAWLTVDIIWPSVLGLVALGFSGYMSVPQVFQAAFSNNNVILVLFMMMIGGIIMASGLADILAHKLVSLQIVKGRPWLLATFLMSGSFILSALFGGAPGAIIIMWGFLYSICEQVGYQPGDRYPMLAACGIVFGGACGNHIFPFHQAVVAPMGFVTVPIDYAAGYFIFAVIFSVVCMGVYMLSLKYYFKADVSRFANANYEIEGETIMDARQKFLSLLLVLMVVLLLLPNFLAKTNPLCIFLNSIGQNAILALIVAAATFVTFKGKKVADINEAVSKGVMWPVFFMLLSAFTIATALTSQDTGVTPFIMGIVNPLFAGHGVVVFMALAVILCAIGTNCINNMVVSMIMIPIATNFAAGAGQNPAAIATLLVIACAVGIALPTGSPAGAIFHGNKAWIPGNEALKMGLYAVGLHTFFLIVLGIPLTAILFR